MKLPKQAKARRMVRDLDVRMNLCMEVKAVRALRKRAAKDKLHPPEWIRTVIDWAVAQPDSPWKQEK